MNTLKRIALTLLIIGGINWGLIGLFQFDLVAAVFGGQDAALSRVIYTLVGLSSLVCLAILFDPMTEMDDRARDPQKVRSENVSYGTEFGTDIDNDPRK